MTTQNDKLFLDYREEIVQVPSELKEGDKIKYFCKYKKRTIVAEVLGQVDNGFEKIIVCVEEGQDLADIIDLEETCIYRLVPDTGMGNGVGVGVSSAPLAPGHFTQEIFNKSFEDQGPAPLRCECGARFTSSPKYHLNYCPMKK